MLLKGKTALITGAAQRIGREIAKTLARRGATVIIHYSKSRNEALALQKEILEEAGEALLIEQDFSPGSKPFETQVKTLIKNLYRLSPKVDILINNAAIFYPTPIGKISEKDWDSFLTVNLKAPFFLSQEMGLRMVKSGAGKIVNLTDWTALRPHPNYLPYAISKAGLSAATIGLARALAPKVQVLSIAPGPILPALKVSRKDQKAVVEKTLLKRFGDPKDIAAAVRFFIEDTDFITGAFLPVDGGASIY